MLVYACVCLWIDTITPMHIHHIVYMHMRSPHGHRHYQDADSRLWTICPIHQILCESLGHDKSLMYVQKKYFSWAVGLETMCHQSLDIRRLGAQSDYCLCNRAMSARIARLSMTTRSSHDSLKLRPCHTRCQLHTDIFRKKGVQEAQYYNKLKPK